MPSGYVSGNPLSDASTYDNATFKSLGVKPGTYVWTWGTGESQNFTLQILAAAVPDAGSTFGLLFLSLAALFGGGHWGETIACVDVDTPCVKGCTEAANVHHAAPSVFANSSGKVRPSYT